jgi:hypothetical protein
VWTTEDLPLFSVYWTSSTSLHEMHWRCQILLSLILSMGSVFDGKFDGFTVSFG